MGYEIKAAEVGVTGHVTGQILASLGCCVPQWLTCSSLSETPKAVSSLKEETTSLTSVSPGQSNASGIVYPRSGMMKKVKSSELCGFYQPINRNHTHFNTAGLGLNCLAVIEFEN